MPADTLYINYLINGDNQCLFAYEIWFELMTILARAGST